MLIYLKNTNRLITVAVSTGDNLTAEDLDNGFVDYFMSSVYRQEGDELELEDAGQILSSKLVGELSLDEVVDKVLDYWEAKDEEYLILSDKGE